MACTKRHDLKPEKSQTAPCQLPPASPDAVALAAPASPDANPDADVFDPDGYAICDGLV